MIDFTIPGPPKGKERPRVSTRNGKPRAYTPKGTADYERLVRTSYALQCGERAPYPESAPLTALITTAFPIPRKASKKIKEQMLRNEIRPTKKPDADNIAKAVLDALNGVAYADDKQIVFLGVSKIFSEEPYTQVTIFENTVYTNALAKEAMGTGGVKP